MIGYTETPAASAAPVALEHDTARLEKFNLALETLNIPREPDPDFSAFPDAQTLSQNEILSHLPFIDPHHGLGRYLNISPSNLSLFRDFFSALLPPSLLDYSLSLSPDGSPRDSEKLLNHLQQIAEQVKDPSNEKPLIGLKVVIDPGHMGSDSWDERTGKYVSVNGKKVSEGMINLWTAYLVANELEELGASVTLTRTEAGPVSSQNYQNFVTTPFVNQYFYDSQDDWMAKYLKLSDSEIKTTLAQKPEVKKAYSAEQHDEFFIGGEDLSARSDIIDRERPDIAIDIHYDALKRNKLQHTANALQGFVPGSFGATETGSHVLRSYALKHLLDVRRWEASVDLADSLVNAMSFSEGIALEKTNEYSDATRVRDGVYTRNLYITRRALTSLMVYLECLHYDNISEFPRFAINDAVGTYHGVSFSYPTRIQAVASGIRSGILNYFKR